MITVEFAWNHLDDDWWFDLGIGCQPTPFHSEKKMVFTIALGIATAYFRW